MKKVLISIIALIFVATGFSQEEKYNSAMSSALADLESSKSITDFQSVANQFERIGDGEKNNWIPYYYAAYSALMMSFIEQDGDKKDGFADNAQQYIDKAMKLKPNESEIIVIQGMLYQARIMVHPMIRGHEYSVKANTEFEKATSINKGNPRIYLLKGKNKLNTPEFFGGGKKNALPFFKEAKEKFDDFKPAELFAPDWGKDENTNLIAQCDTN
jgi:tetratricopeptide (TPR) repeat protein